MGRDLISSMGNIPYVVIFARLPYIIFLECLNDLFKIYDLLDYQDI